MKSTTPYMDAWLASLKDFLDGERGRRAALAKLLAGRDKNKVPYFCKEISQWFRGRSKPNGEKVLAISAWLEEQKQSSD